VYSAASQGRCCSCNLADQLQLGSSDEAVRGGLSCSLGGTGQASAHCLRFDTLWYNVCVAPCVHFVGDFMNECDCAPPTLSITQFTLARSCATQLLAPILLYSQFWTPHPLAPILVYSQFWTHHSLALTTLATHSLVLTVLDSPSGLHRRVLTAHTQSFSTQHQV